MAAITDLNRIIQLCNQISLQAADESGFIPIRNLLSRFGAELRIRPLLVEGILGTPSDNVSNKTNWLVFVDSGRYPYSSNDIEGESQRRPLPPRLRFTIAHELAHTLAFRNLDGSFEPAINTRERESRSSLVKAIERETDKLTSLLLCPENTLRHLISSLETPLTSEFLAQLRHTFGISREALINRLLVSRALDDTGVWQRPHTASFGVVIEEFSDSGQHHYCRWPVFASFTRGLCPELLLRVAKGEQPRDSDLSVDQLAWSKEGPTRSIFRGYAGTDSNPRATQMDIEVLREVRQKPGIRRSLTVVQDRNAWKAVSEFEQLKLARQREVVR